MGKVTVTASIEHDLYYKLSMRQRQTKQKMSKLIENAIHKYFQDEKPNREPTEQEIKKNDLMKLAKRINEVDMKIQSFNTSINLIEDRFKTKQIDEETYERNKKKYVLELDELKEKLKYLMEQKEKLENEGVKE